MNSISPEMWESYRRTEYWINEPFNVGLRVDQKAIGLPAIPWAYLTAWNPNSLLKPEAENRSRQNELENRLSGQGIRCISGVARDPLHEWPDEEGVLALGLEREAALDLGREFNQNAILFGVGNGPVQLIRC